jgi:N-succinyldiaminopimelate aminotransferase
MERFGTTIFAEMTRLAIEHRAINLGQGFPDFAGPRFLKDAAREAIEGDHNQYARSAGVPPLVEAIADRVARRWGLAYDPLDEVTVFSGCTEAIHSSLLAVCEPGDEVILFEPYYDSYHACVVMAGAVPRFVRLRAPELRWDPDELRAAFTSKTRAILVNTPHNPTGRVFDRDELGQIAALCREHDVIVLADEVYDELVFEGEHVPIASLEGMRERTISMNSTGKTFSMTGWKIGWATAPTPLSSAIRTVHQFVTFCTATPLQHAMVAALQAPESYFDKLRDDYRRRRGLLREGLVAAGFELLPQEGTYFQCASAAALGFDDDVELCKHLIAEAGVVAIPPSAFYAGGERVDYVRFAFCKSEPVLRDAVARLARLRG